MAAGDGPPVPLGSGKRGATSALEHEGDGRDGGLHDHRLLVVGRAHERCVTVSDRAQAAPGEVEGETPAGPTRDGEEELGHAGSPPSKAGSRSPTPSSSAIAETVRSAARPSP